MVIPISADPVRYHQKFRKYRAAGNYKKARKYRRKYKKVAGRSLRKDIGREQYSLKHLRSKHSWKSYSKMNNEDRRVLGLAQKGQKQNWRTYVPKVQAAAEKLRQTTIRLARAVAAAKQDKKVFEYYASQGRRK